MPADLSAILGRLSSVPKYHPFEADTFADWALEAGDVVTIRRGDESYQSPIHSTTFKWNGSNQMTLHSTGALERESIAKISQKKYARSGSGIRNTQGLFHEVFSEDGKLHSNLKLTESHFQVYVEDKYNQLRSGLEITSSTASLYARDLYHQMTTGLQLTTSTAALYAADLYNQMTSGLELTTSTAALYVRDMYNQMTSGLELTSSMAALYVHDLYNQMTSGLELTSSMAALYVHDLYNQMTSGLELTTSTAALYVHDIYNQMTSGLELSSSTAALYVNNIYGQMMSGLKLTESSAQLYVQNLYNQMSAGLELTESSAALYVRDLYNQLTSGLELTSSTAGLYVRDMYRQLTSGLELTSSTAGLYVRDMYNQLTSGLELTSSTAGLYVRDMYRQLTSGLELTSSTAALYVRDLYNQMTSGLQLTSSSAALYVRDMYRQMTSGLQLTSSSAALYVRDMYRQMTSGLQLTSSSAALYVSNMYKQMKSGLQLTSSAAALAVSGVVDSTGKVTVASIVAAINNQTGQSIVRISADKISLDGKTKLNDVLTVSDNFVTINKETYITEALHPNGISLGANSGITFTVGTAPPKTYTLGPSNVATMVVDATHSGNVLTITKMNGDVINFSKATTLSGTWSSGQLTVTATQKAADGSDVTVDTYVRNLAQSSTRENDDGTAYSSGNTWNIPINAIRTSGGSQYTESTGFRVYVNAQHVYNAAQNAITLKESWGKEPGSNNLSNSNSYTVQTEGRTVGDQLRKSKTFYLSAPGSFDSSTHKKKVYLSHSNTDAVNRLAEIELDASGVYSDGQTAAGLSWDATYNRVYRSTSSATKEYYLTIKTGTGAATAGTLDVTVNSFNSSHKAFANVRLGTTATGSGSGVSNAGVVTTPYSIQIDATSVYNQGWTAAYNSASAFQTSEPSSIPGTVSFQHVSSTVGAAAQTFQYKPVADDNYAYVKYVSQAGDITVARVSHSAYSNGQTAAGLTYSTGSAKISRSLSSATKEYYITVKPYSGTASQGTVVSIDSSQFNSSYKAGVQVRIGTDDTDNGVLSKLYSVNIDASTIASNAYSSGRSNGWNGASNSVNVSGAFPTNMASSYPATMVVYKPGTLDANPVPYQYEVTVDNDYAYIQYNYYGGHSNVARVANSGYTNGYNNGVSVGESNVTVSAGNFYYDTGSEGTISTTLSCTARASNGDTDTRTDWLALHEYGWSNGTNKICVEFNRFGGPVLMQKTISAPTGTLNLTSTCENTAEGYYRIKVFNDGVEQGTWYLHLYGTITSWSYSKG